MRRNRKKKKQSGGFVECQWIQMVTFSSINYVNYEPREHVLHHIQSVIVKFFKEFSFIPSSRNHSSFDDTSSSQQRAKSIFFARSLPYFHVVVFVS